MRNLHAVSRERLHCVFIGLRFSWVLLLSDCDAFAVKRELLEPRVWPDSGIQTKAIYPMIYA